MRYPLHTNMKERVCIEGLDLDAHPPLPYTYTYIKIQ